MRGPQLVRKRKDTVERLPVTTSDRVFLSIVIILIGIGVAHFIEILGAILIATASLYGVWSSGKKSDKK